VAARAPPGSAVGVIVVEKVQREIGPTRPALPDALELLVLF
jgi:hypothetical protein